MRFIGFVRYHFIIKWVQFREIIMYHVDEHKQYQGRQYPSVEHARMLSTSMKKIYNSIVDINWPKVQ